MPRSQALAADSVIRGEEQAKADKGRRRYAALLSLKDVISARQSQRFHRPLNRNFRHQIVMRIKIATNPQEKIHMRFRTIPADVPSA